MTEARTSAHWAQHTGLGRVLRALAAALPVILSILLTFAASRLLPTPSGLLTLLTQWVVLSLFSTGLLIGLRRIAQRFLPLATMAGLALVFPDRVPSRMGMALRTGSVTDLDERLHHARMIGASGDETQAATGLLELVCDLGSHDRSTRGHSERVRALSQLIGEELGLSTDDLDMLNWSALLHDVGKLDVPRELLNKPGRLDGQEWSQIHGHAAAGARLVRPLTGWLGPWLSAVSQHHERWDGQGYPEGLAGEDIALSARIVSVADAFDAMTTGGAGRDRIPPDEARSELARGAGTQFDPTVVRAFLALGMSRLRVAMGPLAWVANLPVVGRIPITPAIGTVFGAGVAATAIFTGGAGTQANAAPEAPPAVVAEPFAEEPADPPPAPEPTVPDRPDPPDDPEDPPPAPEPPAPTLPPPEPTDPPVLVPPPPLAQDISIRIDEDSSVDLGLREPEDFSIPTPPKHGTLTSLGSGQYRHTPDPDFNGADQFTYQRCADAQCSTSVVRITVTPVNDAPEFTAGADESVLEDAGAQSVAGWATGVSAGPPDESGQSVSFTATADDPGLFSTQPSVSPAGTLTYTPAADADGVALVTVNAVDDGGTADGGNDTSPGQVLTITFGAVNDAPPFTAGADESVLEDAGAQSVAGWATGISAGPPDESGQSVSFTATADDPSLFSTQPAVSPTGGLAYTPAPDANGTALVTVNAVDDGGTANGGNDTSPDQVLTITIGAVNDDPVAADDPDGGDDPAEFETVLLTDLFIPSAELVDNDTDPEGDSLTVADSGPTATPEGSVQCDGTGCTYTPSGSYTGVDTFDYTVADGNGGSDTATVTVLDYAASPHQGDIVINEVLSDGVEGAMFEYSDFIELRNPTASPVDVSGWVVTDNNLIEGLSDFAGGFEYTLPPGTVIGAAEYAVIWMGEDRRAVDLGFTNVMGGGVLELYYGSWVNHLEEAGDDVGLYDDQYRIVDYVAWGPLTEPDRRVPMPTSVGVWDEQPNNELDLAPSGYGVSIVVTPDGTFTADSECWEVTGSGGATCPGALPTVDTDTYPGRTTSVGRDNNSQVAPVPQDDAYSTDEEVTLNEPAVTGLLDNDTDGNGDPLTVNTTPVTPPADGTLTLYGDGSFDYDPDPDTNGSDGFTYEVDDGTGRTNTATVTITVGAVNDPPSFTAGPDEIVLEDAGPQSVAGWATAISPGPPDESGQSVTFGVTADQPGLFSTQPAVSATGTLTYTPAPDANGTATVTVTATDTGGTANGGVDTSPGQLADITVTAAPEAPVASDDAYATDEDVTLNEPAVSGLLANDGDEDGDILTVNVTPVTPPTDGTLTLYGDGAFDYDPDLGFSGDDTFVYEVDDGTGRTATATATVTITVSSAILPGGLYLGDSGPTSEWFDLVAAPLPPAVPVPDYDLDGKPGLTITKSGGNENENDQQKYQEWSYAPPSALELTGPISLDLWSTVADYELDKDVHLKVFAHDCADDNTDCRQLIDADYHVDDWNGGISDFVFRDLTLGTLDTTILPGRMLRLKVMFDHEDVWVAMTDAYRSRLVWNEGPRAPVANDDGPVVLDEDTGPVNVDVLANDGDASLDPNTVTIVSGPSIGTATPRPDGTVDYDPDLDQNGADSFDYQVCDLTGQCSTATVTVTVDPVADRPQAVDDGYHTATDTQLAVPKATGVENNDSDADGDDIEVNETPVSGPAHGSLTLKKDGDFT